MFLESIEYAEWEDSKRSWFLDKLELTSINLIVGKNATGKTRTIHILSSLSNILSGILPQPFDTCRFRAIFSENKTKYIYEIEFKKKQIDSERFIKDDEVLLQRNSKGEGTIYYEKQKSKIEFSIQPNIIASVVKQDRIQHSFLSKLNVWGINTHFYQFGDKMGKNNAVIASAPFPKIVNARNASQVVNLFKIGVDEFGGKYSKKIINDMNSLGYEIEKIGIEINPDKKALTPGMVTVDIAELFVKEKEIEYPIYQSYMSQGMFRSLSLLIQMNYCAMKSIPSFILIDDIGEGLDYDRSVNLLEVLKNITSNSAIQLVMTTNDRFIMNGVPIDNWIVLYREKNHCKNYTRKNAPDTFNDFKFMGLSNFDFFKNEFYKKDS